MIRTHRIAHRGIFLALAVLIPALLLAGIGLRPTVPPVTENEALFRIDGFAQAPGGDGIEVAGSGLRFSLKALSDGRSIVIRPLEIIAKPDLLVYWSPRAPKPDEDQSTRLADAGLVGSLSGRSSRVLQLPDGAQGGYLLVYSLAHGELLADLSLEQLAMSVTKPDNGTTAGFDPDHGSADKSGSRGTGELE